MVVLGRNQIAYSTLNTLGKREFSYSGLVLLNVLFLYLFGWLAVVPVLFTLGFLLHARTL
ncbi:hypothetical protein [Natronosalvus halobius]|uniref:hypothetical protein n=1 Tax=Natronosalvus halobius TaxID=2953746 RepID=UPI00209D4016|nr:hypothetical protein [Natronosalvus halobius]USZ71747.1 hypothetical protein NGM15_00115 [Natronosalvus halobius]